MFYRWDRFLDSVEHTYYTFTFVTVPAFCPISHLFVDALPLLTVAIQAPNAREDLPGVNATENAISAVTKVCKYIDTGVPLDNILPMWLSWLPIVEDKEEAPHVYSYLCDLIER